jgi:hypothetical protein
VASFTNAQGAGCFAGLELVYGWFERGLFHNSFTNLLRLSDNASNKTSDVAAN